MGRVEEFVSASRELWRLVESVGAEHVSRAAGRAVNMYERVLNGFGAAMSLVADVYASDVRLGRLLYTSAVLGLHAAMYQSDRFISSVVDEAEVTEAERGLSKWFGVGVDVLRSCLDASFYTLVTGMVTNSVSKTLGGVCKEYWRRGALLPHVGAVLSGFGKPLTGVPRLEAANALVPWLLSIVRDVATGSAGAGSVAVFGASIGRGKTTTLYYTFTTVLRMLGHPRPEELAKRLIVLNPEDFLAVLEALLTSGEKILMLAVDNASALFPKFWVRVGGEMARFYQRMNKVLDFLRAVCGAVIFVANAPDELASFVRNMATLNIRGEPESHRLYTVTVFTWSKPTLTVRPGSDVLLRRRGRIASVYAYPLLKLPPDMYVSDLQAKREISASELVKAVQSLRAALEEPKALERDEELVGEEEQP